MDKFNKLKNFLYNKRPEDIENESMEEGPLSKGTQGLAEQTTYDNASDIPGPAINDRQEEDRAGGLFDKVKGFYENLQKQNDEQARNYLQDTQTGLDYLRDRIKNKRMEMTPEEEAASQRIAESSLGAASSVGSIRGKKPTFKEVPLKAEPSFSQTKLDDIIEQAKKIMQDPNISNVKKMQVLANQENQIRLHALRGIKPSK